MATSHYRVMSSIAPGESRVWRRVIIYRVLSSIAPGESRVWRRVIIE